MMGNIITLLRLLLSIGIEVALMVARTRQCRLQVVLYRDGQQINVTLAPDRSR